MYIFDLFYLKIIKMTTKIFIFSNKYFILFVEKKEKRKKTVSPFFSLSSLLVKDLSIPHSIP